jgi:hypothetical protein
MQTQFDIGLYVAAMENRRYATVSDKQHSERPRTASDEAHRIAMMK